MRSAARRGTHVAHTCLCARPQRRDPPTGRLDGARRLVPIHSAPSPRALPGASAPLAGACRSSGDGGEATGADVVTPIAAGRRGLAPEEWRNGVFLVDKPPAWTSFDVCNKLRAALGGRRHKVGHAGTLDPLATGLLIIVAGKSTKMVDSFTSMTKVYEGTMRLGEETDSYDSDGIIVETRPWRHITGNSFSKSSSVCLIDSWVVAASGDFLGPIQQTPPMHSAIKVKGKRLYELARKGEKVERPARSVFVSEFEISPRSDGGGQDLNFSIVCSKGTYVRSLVHDLGQTLGCGAHMTALCRTGIGEFSVDDAWSVEKLAECMSNSRAEKSGDGRRRRET